MFTLYVNLRQPNFIFTKTKTENNKQNICILVFQRPINYERLYKWKEKEQMNNNNTKQITLNDCFI